MNTVIFFGIGIVLLILVWAGGRRLGASSVRSSATPEASEYLVQLPPSGLIERCFSEQDVKFVASLGSRRVSSLLLRERRRLALEWLRLTGRETRRLFGLHARTARFAADLRPAAELKLLVQAGAFLLIYEVLGALVWFYGPLRARAYVRSIQGLGSVLAGLGSAIARSVVAGPASRIRPAQGD